MVHLLEWCFGLERDQHNSRNRGVALTKGVHMAGAGAAASFEYTIESAIRGFHQYKAVWSPILNEQLKVRQEAGNTKDLFAVYLHKYDDNQILGHVPKEISRLCWYFLQHDGEIVCTVSDNRRRSPLAQGGLEIPCKLTFTGKKNNIKKLKKLL